MADPIKWKSKIILCKPEATYATDPGATGPLNAMLLTDVTLAPMEGEDVSRNLEYPWLGAQEEIPTALRAVLTGSFELVGSGTVGAPPAWGPLLRACAAAEVITPNTAVVYSPVTDNHESVWIPFWLGPTLYVLRGARGTATISVNAQGIPVCRVTLTGLWTRPTDTARPVVDLTAFQKPQVASQANTPSFRIDSIPFVLRSYELNLGNDVQPRMLVGTERIIIVDRAESLTATVEAVPMATYNPFQRAEEMTRQIVVLDHGTIDGRKVRVSAQQALQRRPGGIEQNQNIAEWPLTFTPLPSAAGNDQWLIRLT